MAVTLAVAGVAHLGSWLLCWGCSGAPFWIAQVQAETLGTRTSPPLLCLATQAGAPASGGSLGLSKKTQFEPGPASLRPVWKVGSRCQGRVIGTGIEAPSAPGEGRGSKAVGQVLVTLPPPAVHLLFLFRLSTPIPVFLFVFESV